MRLLTIPALALSLLLSGCGTIANIHGMDGPLMGEADTVRPRAFGGAANDLEWVCDTYWPVKPFWILDLPSSLIGDVITLLEIRQLQREWDQRHSDDAAKPDGQNSDAASQPN
jgi:uncharacterized protein YceK